MQASGSRPRAALADWGMGVLVGAAAMAGLTHSARGDIDLELRTTSSTAVVGGTFTVSLYAVSSSAPSQSSAGEVILTWDTAFVQLAGLNSTGAPSYLASGFLADAHGLNASLTDGDAMWTFFATPGSPIVATPAGMLLMRFDFTALATTSPTTLINIAATGGSPAGQTIMYDAVIPNTDITGTLSGTSMLVLPTPKLAIVYPGAGALDPGDLVQVKLRMLDIPPSTPTTGFQAFLEFDDTRLSFVNAFYTPVPFGLPIISPITAVGNTLDLAAGINTFIGQPPASGNADLAVLTFEVLTPCGLGAVEFRAHKPPTRLSDTVGESILPLLLLNLDPAATCPGDVVPNSTVDTDDLVVVILSWGPCASPPPVCCLGDTNASGEVDADDLVAVILGWGPCP